jgi:hypothetical protein
MSIEFDFQDVLDEIQAMNSLVEPYQDPRSLNVLDRLKGELEFIRDTPTEASHPWGIKTDAPFCTKASIGQYQPDDQGEHTVYAQITSVWEITRVKPPGKRRASAARFRLTGNASTLVRMMEVPKSGQPEVELAVWREDVGANDSPGCHFHVQIYRDSEKPPNPKSLDVPRLPALMVTPVAVIDYVLGELFQKDWPDHVATKTAELNRLWPIQQRRLGALLAWQFEKIVDATGAPWTALKRSRPESDLFRLDELPRIIPG